MTKTLLLKLNKGKYLARKNAWKYLESNIWIIVSNNDRVIGYAFYRYPYNYIEIIGKNIKDNNTRKLIGENNINQMNEDDNYMIFHVKDYVNLKKPIRLTRKVKGLRYALSSEEDFIKKRIVMQILQENNIGFKDILHNTPVYEETYKYCMEHHLDKLLFEIIREGRLGYLCD